MTARRYLYFFLALWLSSTIVSFYAPKHHHAYIDPLLYSSQNAKGNAYFERFNEILTSDDSEADPAKHPTRRASRKIVIRRAGAMSNMHLPVLFGMLKSSLAVDLHDILGTHWFNKSLLPGYYDFLFRLKPF